jgi:hypothetical protein
MVFAVAGTRSLETVYQLRLGLSRQICPNGICQVGTTEFETPSSRRKYPNSRLEKATLPTVAVPHLEEVRLAWPSYRSFRLLQSTGG